jgi:superfamily II DNA or RNA helicase
LLTQDTGVLAATTAFGKTVVAAWLIAQRGVNTLILVHRQQLLEQWIERLSSFLNLPPKAIGRLGGGRKTLTGTLDVALLQSLVRKEAVDDRVADYGHLIVDECHHISARSFELAVRRAKAKFITGLSATVTRKDGHHPIIFMQCGPVRHRVDAKTQAAARPFNHHVLVRPTDFRAEACDPDPRVEFQKLYAALWSNDKRNQLICADVVNALKEGRSPLVLTERREHLDRLAQLLSPVVPHLIRLQGGQTKKVLAAALAQLAQIPETAGRAVLATGGYIGEGFDDPRLDSLFLALPVSWRGTVAQYVGRLHRLHEGKREVRVYDYADLNVPMLSRMFDRRCRGYESLGYTILLPGSALPGWPSEVPPAFADSSATEWTFPWRIFSFMWHGLLAPTPREKLAPGAPAKPFFFAACRPCQQRPVVFASMRSCRFHLMAMARWRWTCYVRKPGWLLNWMAHSIWLTLKRIGGTGGRTPCCNKMVILYCGSWRKTQASVSIRFWMPFWPPSFTVKTDRDANNSGVHLFCTTHADYQPVWKIEPAQIRSGTLASAAI